MNTCIKTVVIGLLLILSMPMAKLSAQVSVWDGTWEPWTHGTGTEADPFLIENAQQLAYLAYRVNNGLDAGGGHVSNHNYHYKLMIDVDLNGSEDFQWTPIGYSNPVTDYQRFGGYFDGNNHTILNLYLNCDEYYVGFFAYTEGATIMNLALSGTMVFSSIIDLDDHQPIAGGVVGVAYSTDIMNCSTNFTDGVFARDLAGGIVGYLSSGSVTNCHNTGTISAYLNPGGILGRAFTATITNCYNTGTVSITSSSSWSYSNSYSGGILGRAGTTTIINCSNTGTISTSTGSSSSGGILGYALTDETITITNCYNTGSISSSYYSNNGGILGQANGTSTATITNCYNTGTISASYYSGGIVGLKNNGAVTNSYYLNTCGGDNTYGGQPMSAEAMQTQDFVDLLNNGYCVWEYDYNNTNSGYPVLNDVIFSAFTKPATNIAATTATLNGSIIVENTNVITKGFEYRITGTSNFTTINVTGNSNDFSYNLINLTPNTTYDYRAFVNVSDCDITAYGEIETFEVTWQNQDTIFIYDANMLHMVAEQCNSGFTFEGKCVKLMNDIELPFNVPNNMISIGSYPNYPFKGTFDGNGKLISNLYIDQPNTPYQGFFGYTLNANLYNVGLVNITASGRNYTGGMVAYAENTHMRDCYVNGGTLYALSYCGGLVGYQEQGTNSIISGCYNTCEVTGNNYVGGLIGFSNYSTVRNSYVAGRVAAQGEPVGAIIGGANEVLMYYCYFSIELTGQTVAIGENNFKDGEGLTNEQMRDPQFVATLNQGLVVPVWKPDYETPINNGFPIIMWQEGGTTGIEENHADKSIISLYPNPVNDKVTIKAEDLKYIAISNLLGQTIFDGNASGNEFEYDFSKHKAGIYLIRIETASGVVVKKVSVTR